VIDWGCRLDASNGPKILGCERMRDPAFVQCFDSR
jgi:hypothetical protein